MFQGVTPPEVNYSITLGLSPFSFNQRDLVRVEWQHNANTWQQNVDFNYLKNVKF